MWLILLKSDTSIYL